MAAFPFRRSRRHRLIAGLCGGVAQRYGWNLSLVRVVWLVVAAIPVLPGAVAYVLLWLCVPLEDDA
jgi:phage shock protein PspC (stress-responsive transcriptional regulator)